MNQTNKLQFAQKPRNFFPNYPQKKIKNAQAIYKTFDTDISVLVNGRLFVLIEHQSAPNENMPLRCLEYYVHLLYGIVPAEFRYRETLYKIPTPEFYVFYNGNRKEKKGLERERTMRLSDAFIEPQEDPSCEVKVKLANIGGEAGKKLPVVQKLRYNERVLRFYGNRRPQPFRAWNVSARRRVDSLLRQGNKRGNFQRDSC